MSTCSIANCTSLEGFTMAKKNRVRSLVMACAGLVLLQPSVFGRALTQGEIQKAADTFLVARYPAKAGQEARTLTALGASSLAVEKVTQVTKEVEPVGFVARLQPSGFVLLSADDECPPVKYYSHEGTFSNLPPGFVAVLKTELAEDLYLAKRGDTETEARRRLFQERWSLLLQPEGSKKTLAGDENTLAAGVPLLSTTWGQNSPYNYCCPDCSSWEGAPAGCNACAVAQVLRYHRSPMRVTRDHTYTDTWGDCRGIHSISDAGMGAYDWANMPNSVSDYSPVSQKQAIGQLMWHAAVAMESDYERDGTGAYPRDADNVFRRFFSYTCNDYVTKSSSSYTWYTTIQADIDAGKPVFYAMWQADGSAGHSVVCDGYRNNSGYQIHLNLGWDGYGNGWYPIDSVNVGGYTWTIHAAVFDITPPSTAVPDLTPTIDVTPEPLQWGQSFSAALIVRNGGNASAGASTAKIYLSANSTITTSDYELDSWSVSSLSGGGSRTYTRSARLPDSPPAGFTATDDVYIGVVVDVHDGVEESNENNNTASDPVHMDPPVLPDLTGTIDVTPEPLRWGDAFSVSVSVQNEGARSAGASTAKIHLSADATITTGDHELDAWDVGSIAAGGSRVYTRTYSLPATPPAGFTATDDVYVIVVIDDGDVVVESHEGNNTAYDPVHVDPPLPDLTGTIDVTPEPLRWGDAFSASVTVRNEGAGSTGASTAKIYLSADVTITTGDHELDAWPVESITTGGSRAYTRTCSLPGAPPTGLTASDEVYIGVLVDATGALEESNEGNNTTSDQVHVDPPRPDLTGTIDVTPEPLRWGDTYTASGSVLNGGLESAGASRAKIYLSADATITTGDHELDAWDVGSITAGGSITYTRTLSLPPSLPAGFTATDEVYFWVLVDATGALEESNEGNNTASDQVHVDPPLPDLTGTIDVTPEPLRWGDVFAASGSVLNRGLGSAGASRAKIYLSTDATINTGDHELDAWDMGSITAGGSRAYTRTPLLPSTPPAGFTATAEVYFGVLVDATGALEESNEGNNTASDQVHVDPPLPDLTGTIDVTPEPLRWGDVFAASGSVLNRGLGSARGLQSEDLPLGGRDHHHR